MLKYGLFISTIILLVSCGSENQAEIHNNWDSRSYFQLEATRLKQEHKGLQKNLFFDQQQQTILQMKPDWEKELEPFIAIDLKKPAYQKRFSRDTVYTADEEYCISYIANDSQVDLRSCIIQYHHRQIVSVTAEFSQRNSIYRSSKNLEYRADSSYSISGDQDITMGSPVHYRVEGKFVNP